MTNRNPIYSVTVYSDHFGLDMPKDCLVYCMEDDSLWVVTEDSDLNDSLDSVAKRRLNPGVEPNRVGELIWLDDYIEPSSNFPAYCLNQETATITTTNYPDLVPFLRNKKITYGLNTSIFNVTSWAISANVATLTLAKNSNFSGTVTASNSSTLTFSSSQSFTVGSILVLSNGSYVRILSGSGTSWVVDIAITISSGTGRVLTKEEIILLGLAEDLLIYGSYTNWRTITLANAIGNINAGDYAISNINTTNNQVSFVYESSNASGSGSFTIEFYTNRVIGSSTSARIFQNTGRVLYGVNDFDFVSGLRKRNTMQGHWHVNNIEASARAIGALNLPGIGQRNDANPVPGVSEPISDRINGSPRTGKNTTADSYNAYLYIWAGTYTA